MTRFPLEFVVNVNSIVKVNHTVKCEITLLLNDKQDEVPSRICHENQRVGEYEELWREFLNFCYSIIIVDSLLLHLVALVAT